MSLIRTSKDVMYTAIMVVIVLLAAFLGYWITSGGTTHTIYAQFSDAEFVLPGNTVHVNGVTEGKVDSMKVVTGPNGQAIADVKLTLDQHAWPVYADATATVRPISLLGEEYVDLNLGTPSSGRLGGSGAQSQPTILADKTTSATNLQSVLDSVSDKTSTSLGLLLTSLGEGMNGEGLNGQAAIKALAPAMTDTSGLLSLVNSQNELLNSMIDNVTPVLGALDTNQGNTLNGLLTTTNNLLGATAQSSQNIGTDLQELPGTLHAASNTFNQLGNLSDQATPALASITPLTDNLNTVSHEILNFSDAANPAVSSLTPLLNQAQTLINKATPVVSELKATGTQQLADMQNGVTVVNGFTGALPNFFSFIAEWASTTGDYDTTSHYFRFHADAACTAIPVANDPLCPATAPANTAAKPAATPAASAKPAAATPATTTPGGIINNILTAPGQIVNNVVGGLLGNAAGTNTTSSNTGSATGLSSGQEQNLVGYLLGGL